ncbi:hypothetical protein MXL49_13935 [Enterococcus casseliflavus]|uniref:hypothetical protein n=1 Tax=Enterococcus casseliflavus TaxID=37734 RepID=UPI002DBDFB26|nr:hypothetical protein [Enterococcus casseliflavus]MEB6212983.1 hypothetical protein [Enterococcus casseliflavus]
MKKYKNKNSFAILPNRAHAWGTDSYMNNDEKMIYLELWFMQQIGDFQENGNKVVKGNVDSLVQDLGWETQKKSRGRNRVIKALNSLRSKNYILFKSEDLTLANKENLTLIISGLDYETVVEADAPWSNNVRQMYGYTKIMAEEYNSLKAGKHDLTLYLYAKYRENIKYRISYLEWSMVLGTSERHAKRIISETVAIRKYQGAFNEVLGKNNTNSYKAKTNTYKQAQKASEKQTESTEQVSEPVVETTVETPAVKEQETQSVVAETVDNGIVEGEKDMEKVVSQNEASLSQSEIEKMQYFEEVERQQMEVNQIVVEKEEKEETVEENAYVASANFIYEMSNFDKMYDDLFDEDDEPADKKSKSKSVMALTKTKDDKIQEALMKQVTDKRVKNNMSLLRQIQDFGVGMTFQAYMIIKDTDDYKLRQWGTDKIKQIASNENGLIKMQNFEKKYQKMQPKTGVSTDV